MKILYAIQGTGNGHMARAYEVIPQLQKYGDVDLLVSGTQCDIRLPWPIKYRYHGLSFIFGKNGGVDLRKTILGFRPFRMLKEIFSVPVHKYDLVLNDFEPIVAWASTFRQVKCIGISHQSAVLHPNAPAPASKDKLGYNILKYYAPCKQSYGFHFQALDKTISTPVIRKDIRSGKITNKGHYTVYLPSYDDQKIVDVLSQIPYIQWQVFSKHNSKAFQSGNVQIQPVNKDKFTESFISSMGILCNAGFETPAEALFMGKKLCVIPMKGQYEQQCNAAFLENMGICTLKHLSSSVERLNEWVYFDQPQKIAYADNLSDTIEDIIENVCRTHESYPDFAINQILR
ncbi:glycosyltransferase family protein [Carboxylicivirga sp. N1Y90]|uniref:glycosyltransferase family protein n=1 Tax=Carboxylicivirga fragile TaxID=3417571 RepID=UPI003D359580|nr:glycosyl transferase [Marinilabiliaceae bacterium N1Y90]